MGTTVEVSIDEEKVAEAQEPLAEIDLDELQQARRDPRIREFLRDAKAYGKKLNREGRINPNPAP